MLRTNYVTIDDFKIVDVADHCDWDKLNIAIDDALNFELPELLCEYYGIVLDTFKAENPTEEQLKLLNGDTYQCGNVTIQFLGLKKMLVYYSYSNYLMGSVLNDTGLGFVKKTDQYSIPTPYKDIKEIANSYRNRGYAIIKQLKEYICHNKDLAINYNIKFIDCGCGCESGNCDFTEKRIFVFKPKIIKR